VAKPAWIALEGMPSNFAWSALHDRQAAGAVDGAQPGVPSVPVPDG
jgi:hypothetical protein